MILVDGERTDCLPVGDRGLQYGDGLFETIAVRGGRPLAWPRHLCRLAEGCARLGIPMPPEALLDSEVKTVIDDEPHCTVKLIVTRGGGPRGYRPPVRGAPTRIFERTPAPVWPSGHATAGVRLRRCATRLGGNTRLAGIKHLNRLEQVLARGEWNDEYEEGLMFDEGGGLVEGTMSNVFLVSGGILHTPDLGRCGVAGVMRACVLDAAARLGIEARVRDIAPDEIACADGLFVTNALIGLWPVREIDDRVIAPHPLVEHLRMEIEHAGELP